MEFVIWSVRNRLREVRDYEEGQGLVEYALILSLVSIATIALLEALGTSIGGVLTDVIEALGGALPA